MPLLIIGQKGIPEEIKINTQAKMSIYFYKAGKNINYYLLF